MECRHFGRCGSCRWYEEGYEGQLTKKAEEIKAMFAPLYSGAFDIARSAAEGYRARAEFKVWHVGDTMHFAMNSIDRDGVVLLEECPMVTTPIQALMWPLLDALNAVPEMGRKLFGMDFLAGRDGDIAVSMLYHRKLDDTWKAQAAEMAARFGISIIGRSRKQKEVIGCDHVIESVDVAERTYRFKQIENSFTQPNPGVNAQMIGWALKQFEGLGGDLLELYCGAGNFTIPFASRFDRVLATEISKSSIHAAKTNMELNDVHNIDFVRMSAEEFVQALDGVREFNRMKGIDLPSYRLDTIFVDPPRAGMDEASCDFAARHEHILYISCNPETLKRDLEYLTRTHSIEAMAMFDQFPYTHHMEMGVRLKKAAQ
ncbi:tRNA (uridine(54)-C5)-methyltransferase TrmA [Sulfurimonas sp. HSL-3221]|uniref:tRNA (uridine(54)-C5)-methyltransferase TrmA n=1 Tax=Sulfurimonadaceae TaxID=2771471 RepID=UPI001E465DC5|nr:tRNA (uridine(54)-C5)-methyltransferase TrmA [Sulfurimonas sp. HSL-3221]UFS63613.1 tRNA (uridine(54)-C5)-methyltransferase TrmA [Sulfurimonas sp. HSL-3221]